MKSEIYKENCANARKDLVSFCIMTDPSYKPNWHHEYLADCLMDAYERVRKGERVRMMIQMPPRHGKSELGSIKFPAWVMGNDPTMDIIITAYGSDLAEDFGGSTRNLVNDEKYMDIFPYTKIARDTRSKKRWSTTKGGKLTAVGVGGALTGRGGQIIVVDDPFKNAEEAYSEPIRQKKWDWYTSTLTTRLEGPGAIIIINTRWHTDDLSGRLISKEKKDLLDGLITTKEWEIVNFPAIAEEKEVHPLTGDILREEGDALWPDKFDVSELRKIHSDVGDDVWFALYQQNPISIKNAVFTRDKFRYYDPAVLDTLNLTYYTMVDPASSKAKRADNSVVLTVAKDKDSPHIYRVKETAGKFDEAQLIDIIFMHYQEYRSQIYVEVTAGQKFIMYPIRAEMTRREVFFYLGEINTRGDKEAKIKALASPYSNGFIHHIPNDKEYESELVEFPNGKHDDRIDAMAMFYQMAPITPRKKYAEETETLQMGNYSVFKPISTQKPQPKWAQQWAEKVKRN